jgi:hypothetical protein
MSGLHSLEDQSVGGGLGRKVGLALLYTSISGGVAWLFQSFGHTLQPGHLTGLVGVVSAAGSAIAHAGEHIAYHGGAHKVIGTIWDHDAGRPTPSGLNHDIERALTRAAARTISILAAEWTKLPATQRAFDREQWDVEGIIAACELYLRSGDSASKPEILEHWLDDVSRAKFLDLPEMGAAPWNASEDQLPPEPPCKFIDWFQWRYPAAFRLNFADELASDSAAARKFSLTLQARMLDLQKDLSTDVSGVKSDTAEIKKSMADLALRLQSNDQQWLSAMAAHVSTALQGWQPRLVEVLTATVKTELFAGLKQWAAEGMRSLDQIMRETTERLGLENQRLERATMDLGTAVDRLVFHNFCTGWGITAPSGPQLAWRAQLDAYALFALRKLGNVELLQALARSEDDAKVLLGDVFVEPEIATLRNPRAKDWEGLTEEREHKLEQGSDDKAEDAGARKEMLGKAAAEALGAVVARRPAFEALCDGKQHLHILLGDPGSGKSTLQRLLVLRWAEDHLRRGCGREDGPAPRPVPLLTEVRAWLAARDRQPGLTLLGYHCREHVEEYHFHPSDVASACKEGRARLLVDGLDEAFVRLTRETLRSEIRALAGVYPLLPILVTSRGFNFEAQPWRERTEPGQPGEWTFHTVEQLDDKRITEFLEKWHHAGHHEPALREKRKKSLAAAIQKHPHIRRLAVNPMLLTLLCIVVRGGPAEGGAGANDISRKDLYDEAERLLLHRWDSDRGLPLAEGGAAVRLPALRFEERRSFFLRVAATMTDNAEAAAQRAREQAAASKQLFDPTTLPESNQIDERALTGILEEVAPDDDPKDVLTILRERNYLLCYRGDGAYSFIHRSFLEYFTALNWSEAYANDEYAGPDDLFATVIEPRWRDETWHETLRFLIALLKNPVAVKCLDLLASRVPEERAGDMPHEDGAPPQRELEALVLAAELAREVSPYVHTGGARPSQPAGRRSPREIVAPWKDRLLEFAHSAWDGSRTPIEEDSRRRALRRRAFLALAALWSHDVEMRDAILYGKTPSALYRARTGDIADALVAGWAGDPHSKLKFLHAVTVGTGTRADSDISARAVLTLAKGWTGDADAKAAVLRLTGVLDADLHLDVVRALSLGWPGDSDVRAALLRVFIGVPEQGIEPDARFTLRWYALDALATGWSGDPELRQALLRVFDGAAKHSASMDAVAHAHTRLRALDLLGRHWPGDGSVKSLLLRLAFGDPEQGAELPEDSHLRQRAINLLEENWASDRDVEELLQRWKSDAAERGKSDESEPRVPPQN